MIPREILGDPQSAQITRSFSSWAPLLKTTDGKELAWRMERFIGLHPAGGYSMNTATSHIEFEPACILIEDGNLFFRTDSAFWPKQLESPGAQIVIRQTGALVLWSTLAAPDGVCRGPYDVVLHGR